MAAAKHTLTVIIKPKACAIVLEMLHRRLPTHENDFRTNENIKAKVLHHVHAEIQQITVHDGQICLENMVQGKESSFRRSGR